VSTLDALERARAAQPDDWTPPPESPAVRALLAELDAFRLAEPELYAWIASGAPRVTEADHLELFGKPYEKRKRK
jgi:hypothetical protein